MAAATYNITVEQGATYALSMIYRGPDTVVGNVVTPGDPIDVSGCVATMQIRQAVGSPVLLQLTETDGITVGNTNGHLDIVMTEAKTALLTVKRAKYDFYITFPGGTPTRKLLVGKVTVVPTITSPTTV